MDVLVNVLLDVAANSETYKIEDDMRAKLKALIGALSADAQSKAALEKASASFDQSKLAKFMA